MTKSALVSARRDLQNAPLLVAARGGRPSRQPVWFMRQAGRSLPEYRSVREGVPMLESCLTPDLACEITLQPVRRHGVDAAILFSDIVVPLKIAGIGVEIVAGTGPVVAEPVRTAADVAALPTLEFDAVAPVAEAIRIKPGHAKTVYDWIRDAHKNGARFWACPANLDLFDMTAPELP